MIEATFFLDTTREIFESWLVKTWKPVEVPTRSGTYHLQDARRGRGQVGIDAWLVSVLDEEDTQTALPLGWNIAFEAIPLRPERIEVRGTCTSSSAELLFLELLDKIGARWPESGLAPAVIDAEEPTAAHGSPAQERIKQRRVLVAQLMAEHKTEEKIVDSLGGKMEVSLRTIQRDKAAIKANPP